MKTCLDIYEHHRWPTLGHAVTFAEVDWVYTLNRAQRQAGTLFAETKAALASFADEYIPYLLGLDPSTHENFNDLHTLFGCVCALAELQAGAAGVSHERQTPQACPRSPAVHLAPRREQR